MPQHPNVDQIKKAWALKRQGGMSQQTMAEELGLDPRTISNYFRPAWLAERNLGHLRFASQEPRVPRSTLENRAWEMCESGEADNRKRRCGGFVLRVNACLLYTSDAADE